jgi:hypothetical protein
MFLSHSLFHTRDARYFKEEEEEREKERERE